ncbi:MAG TPA: SDR family NAD(P)-dependent oxidoreductase [Chloroflexota bacterium]
MQELPWNRAIVVGASSGIGEELARQLARGGSRVALVGRRAESLEAICNTINAEVGEDHAIACAFDVRDVERTGVAFQQLTTTLGGLDLVIYAAGIMPRVGPHEFPTEADRATIDTNLTGAVAWLNEAALRFSRAGDGIIVGISSVAGDRGRRGNPVYGATKAGLETYLESLRNRLAVRGVKIVTVKAGYVQTALLEGLKLPQFLPAISAEDAARQILDAAKAGKRVAYVPEWWRWVMLLVRSIPAPIMERLSF